MNTLTKFVLIWLFLAGPVLADTPEQGIIVTGEGRVSSPPDMATISLGVARNAASAQEVMAEVTNAVAAILAKLDGIGIASIDRQTSGFYLQPVHNDRARSDSSAPEITGYRAGNTVTVRVRDLTRLGPMMDAVIAIGANDFNGLNFSLQDASTALAAARALAVADARLRAEQLARAAGLNLGTVLRMTENSNQGGPMMMAMNESRSAMSDAIASGEVDVTAQVTMVFSIAPGGQ